VSPEHPALAALPGRLAEAVDCALLNGLLKYTPEGRLAHAPFALTPCPLPAALNTALEALSAPFNRLAHAVARAPEFLHETLAPAARVDAFTARLLAMAAAGRGQRSLYLAVTRSDYFAHQSAPDTAPEPRQVELNTISASYPGLAGRVARVHRYLLGDTPLAARLAPNDPLPGIADAFAQACARYGGAAAVLLVVQPAEANIFDQRLLEAALRERGLPTLRRTLEQVAAGGRLREGHLVVDGVRIAIAYFRAAYGPEDFRGEDAFRARALIEASSAIAVPDLCTQLAGSKKVQQALTDPALLRRFLSAAEAQAVGACFAGQYDLEQPLPTPNGPRPAWQAARERPEAFVLKPQREGGGNNLFGAAMAARLGELDAAERPAWVLMEHLHPVRHPALLVRDGAAQPVQAVSEIGRFAVLLAEDGRELLNRDVGYLVRSKAHDVHEGGVSAGFGFLSSLLLDVPAPA
jgi:glutathione synthase